MKLLKIFERKKIENNDIIVVKPIISNEKKAILHDANNNKYYRPCKFQIIDKVDKNLDEFINKLRETSINQADYITELERKIKILEAKNTEFSENTNSLKRTIEQLKIYNRNYSSDLKQIIYKQNKQIDSLTETIEFKDNIIEKQNNHLIRISHKNDNRNRLINILLESNVNKKSHIKKQSEVINNINDKLNNNNLLRNWEENKKLEEHKKTIKKLEEQIEKDKLKRNIIINEKDNQIKVLTENLNNAKKKIDDLIKISSQNKLNFGYKLNLNEINIDNIIHLCKEDFKNLKTELNDRASYLKTKISDYEYFEQKLNEYIQKYQLEISDLPKAMEILINYNNNFRRSAKDEIKHLNSENTNIKTDQYSNYYSQYEELLNAINNIETLVLNFKDKNESETFAANLLNQTIKFEENKILLFDFFNHINHEINKIKTFKH